MATNDKGAVLSAGWIIATGLAYWIGNQWTQVVCSYHSLDRGIEQACRLDVFLPYFLHHSWDIYGGPYPLLGGLFGSCIVLLLFCLFGDSLTHADRSHAGQEHGSARKAEVSEVRGYRDPKDPSNNRILTRNVHVAITPNDHVARRLPSGNVLVVGATGTGKTTGYVMPNLLQTGADRDVVVVDPKGTTLTSCGHALIAAGYDIRVFDTRDNERSDRYNPLAYIQNSHDIVSFTRMLVECTSEGRKSQDKFWEDGESLLYRALLTLLLDWFPRRDLTMRNLVALTDLIDVAADGSDAKSPLDLIFDQIETGMAWEEAEGETFDCHRSSFADRGREETAQGLVRVPSLLRRRDGVRPALVVRADGTRGLDPSEDEALRLWHEFRHGASRTLRSFVIASHARMSNLSAPDVLDLLAGDEGKDRLGLNELGRTTDDLGRPRPPRVVFVISSDYDRSLSVLMSLAMWQAIHLPMDYADRNNGTLSRHLSVIIDEFRNIGTLVNFEGTMNVVRSRNIDITIILQAISQLEDVYKPAAAASIKSACAMKVFLGGGRDMDTARAVSKAIGKATHEVQSLSRKGYGPFADTTVQVSTFGRDLYDPNEVGKLPADRALVLMGQEDVVEDDKARVWDLPAYDETYMGRVPERVFDYAAWREAGRPTGAALDAWERAWFGRELPAREALKAARRDHAIATERLSRALDAGIAGTDRAALEAAEETSEKREDEAKEALERAHAASLEAAAKGRGQDDVPTAAPTRHRRRGAHGRR